jgi:hypothetical protein
LPEIDKYDTNKLFEEFKRHLFKENKREVNKSTLITNDYKNLLGEVRKNK